MTNRRFSATAARTQRGGFLLEALVGILIFTLGVLGLFAMQARAIGYSSDVQYRGEAAYMANAYLSKMWADGRGNLTARYDDPGETEYDALQAAIFARLPGAAAIPNNPRVTITQPGPGGMPNAGPNADISLTGNSTLVEIQIFWQQPAAEGVAPVTHNYTMSSILGIN